MALGGQLHTVQCSPNGKAAASRTPAIFRGPGEEDSQSQPAVAPAARPPRPSLDAVLRPPPLDQHVAVLLLVRVLRIARFCRFTVVWLWVAIACLSSPLLPAFHAPSGCPIDASSSSALPASTRAAHLVAMLREDDGHAQGVASIDGLVQVLHDEIAQVPEVLLGARGQGPGARPAAAQLWGLGSIWMGGARWPVLLRSAHGLFC